MRCSGKFSYIYCQSSKVGTLTLIYHKELTDKIHTTLPLCEYINGVES
jgi:hypothetical protein